MFTVRTLCFLNYQEQLRCSDVGEIKFLSYEDFYDCSNEVPLVDACDFYFRPLIIVYENGNVLHKITKSTVTEDKAIVDLTKVAEHKNAFQISAPTNKPVIILTKIRDSETGADRRVRGINNFKVRYCVSR